jgi:hypothetical protein
MRVRECPECERSWDDYTDAAFTFMRLDAEVKMAQLGHEPPEVGALLKEGVEAAAQRRDAALECLKQHEATHQLVNIAVFCWFAFAAWPVLTELSRLRRDSPPTKI